MHHHLIFVRQCDDGRTPRGVTIAPDGRTRTMASTQIELARRAHEEIERLERAATRTLKDNAPTTHRARLEQNRLVDEILRASVERAKRLVRACVRTRGSGDARCDDTQWWWWLLYRDDDARASMGRDARWE